MLDGRMMHFPLTIGHLLGRAGAYFGKREIVDRRPDGSLARTTYGDVVRRCARLARALDRLGVGEGARVATLCWNHHEHLEAYLGVPASGRVVHTLNLRLHPNELAYIARHAEDEVVIVDRSLLPLFEKFCAEVPSLRHVVVVPDCPKNQGEKSYIDYESMLAAERDDERDWPLVDENAAAMLCYTSGTTGNPKGVLFSHRSTVLHALVACGADTLGVCERDAVLPVVPMFHAAAWGLPYIAITVGAKIVFPGPKLDADSLLDLMATERVTIAGGVPTIWIGILDKIDREPKRWDLSSVRSMIIGGSAAPPAMIDGFAKRHGLTVTHAWGMTELNPLGTIARLKVHLESRGEDEKLGYLASQGRAVPFVETRHVDAQGRVLPWDAATMGELEVRGPWVASSYWGDEGKDRWTKDGWFKTGDVVTIDAEGFVRICDRSKDVIKSGGEWISSVAIENALMAHPAVLEAAVFAAHHEKWSERPVAAIVWRPGKKATFDDLRAHLESRFAKFWIPDAFLELQQIPRTSTGKFLKTKLRDDHGDCLTKKENG